MRGALFIVIVVALLIVGFLVVKNTDTFSGRGSGPDAEKVMKKAEKAAESAEKALDKIRKAAE